MQKPCEILFERLSSTECCTRTCAYLDSRNDNARRGLLMEVHQQLLCSPRVDADQLSHSLALDQGHEVVAADEVKDGVLPEPQ